MSSKKRKRRKAGGGSLASQVAPFTGWIVGGIVLLAIGVAGFLLINGGRVARHVLNVPFS
jgi:hypothetical protein